MTELLPDLLRASAESHGGRPAVIDGARSLTYAELDAQANRLARMLLTKGVLRGDRVGLFLEKSLEAVIGIHGVLKAGAAYVPLDPQAPPARLAYIARDADLHLLVTVEEKAREWSEVVGDGPSPTLIALDAEPSALEAHAGGPPDVGTDQDDLAYILYTSGSTGEPKGVALSHLNAMTFVSWAVDQFEVTSADRLSSHAPLHFDLSIFDLFAAAAAGAAVVLLAPEAALFPSEVSRWIEENEITIWYSVPSALSMLVLRGGLAPGRLPRLRSVLFAGEVFPTKYLIALMELLPGARFYNLYGPTETNVCTWYDVPPLSDGAPDPLPIGKPIAGVQVLAVGEAGRAVAPGEVGELCVHGPSVMRGYWGDPEKSARALAPLRAAGLRDTAVYRTGDLVRQDGDGNYLFLGRRDAQVKRRGYRIELGEIERALEAHPSVVECAARATPDELGGTTITAFVVVRDPVTEADLISACLERIPGYAVPDALEFRPVLPKTSTGKVDRKALLPG